MLLVLMLGVGARDSMGCRASSFLTGCAQFEEIVTFEAREAMASMDVYSNIGVCVIVYKRARDTASQRIQDEE